MNNTEGNSIGRLVYWFALDQKMCLQTAEGGVIISLKQVAGRRAQLCIEAPKSVSIQTTKPLQLNGQT